MKRLTFALLLSLITSQSIMAQSDMMKGYLGAPMKKAPKEFGAGFSMYVAAWPLLEKYPGRRFQTGLFGTWMFAQKPDPKPKERAYSDIEGGLGWWRDTRFATETPKFIMGGVALNFSAWANGPGAGKGRDWKKPQGKYGVAQLSPWILWPPDGLNLKQGTCGELLGYGYLPLPLTDPKKKTAGKDFPTGNQSWTLFLNSKNFKGPVAFFTPYFFARSTEKRPDLYGKLLDSAPSDPNRQIQMETQYIPSIAKALKRKALYAKVAHTRFPADEEGNSILVHRVASYKKSALWDAVDVWFKGGPIASGQVANNATHYHEFTGKGWSSWEISHPGQDKEKEKKLRVDWSGFATPFAPDAHTFAYRWDHPSIKKPRKFQKPLLSLPRYYELVKGQKDSKWQPRKGTEVRIKRSLDREQLGAKKRKSSEPYVTPTDGCWASPGPVAGPFRAKLGDGSVVTYSWYRFADQPAMLNADLTQAEREKIQKRVERLHKNWTKDKEYLAAPTRGSLASIDAALIVQPPKGLEFGYVPIVTRQEAGKK